MIGFPDWNERLDAAIDALQEGRTEHETFLHANGQAIARAIAGLPVDGGQRRPEVGGCVVVNISTAHVPAFARPGGRYKNCYELEHEQTRIGVEPPFGKVSEKRRMVDEALVPLHGRSAEDIHFAAIEFNGCGIAFYGDCCLVLDDDVTQASMVILDRNSYDLIRDPLKSVITREADARNISESRVRSEKAAAHAGWMDIDLAAMAAIKVLESRQTVTRLLTTGAISEGVLDDEDYIEVLRPQTFDVRAVREARLAPAEVALDERIRNRALTGRPPSQAETLWCDRRKTAETYLEAIGIPVRVVTSPGRMKG